MKIPELLAPAGNMEKLKVAVHYGADAVYLGGKAFGLRNLAGNFTPREMEEAVAYAHARGVKAYLTVNAYPANDEIGALYRYLEEVGKIPFDAYIAADPGVIETIRDISPRQPIHLSTQANTTNWKSARFWQNQGITRINLAREMSLEGIRDIKGQVEVELEVFVHGAMCISYSGRCLLSSVMTGRPANRGECAHPCRWSYALVEETRPGEYFPVVEDESGTFIFNSKDICLIQYLPELIGTGVHALKIEGRMKGIHYVASVVRVYREALDRFRDDPENYRFRKEWLDELCKISHRGYSTGFFLGPPRDIDHEYHSRYTRSHDFIGVVEEVKSDGSVGIEVRNRIKAGDELEFIGRGMSGGRCRLAEFWNADGTPITVAHPNQRIMLRLPFPAERYDLIRREKATTESIPPRQGKEPM